MIIAECKPALISTVSEKIIDLANFKAEDINVWDIAWGMMHNIRYNGQTPVAWDVLSHTGMAYALYMAEHRDNPDPRVALAILLHDAAEAYVGDVTQPIKCMPEMDWFLNLEDSISQVIFARFGLDWHTIDWKTVKYYDVLSYMHEVHWLKPTSADSGFFTGLDVKITRYMPLGKAKPSELVGLLKQGAIMFGAKDIGQLFEIPTILKPYIEDFVEQTEDADIPQPRSTADVDGMRI